MEKIYQSGLARAIGVSNFMSRHLDELLINAKIVPAVDQFEYHPHWSQQPLVAKCEKLGIACKPGILLEEPARISSTTRS